MKHPLTTNNRSFHVLNLAAAAVLLFLWSIVCKAIAAPLPPFDPVDIGGTIVKKEWVPERSVRGVPGMSGSAGKDRTFPAHFRVVLVRYAGISARTAQRINFLAGFSTSPMDGTEGKPKEILLLLPHNDPFLLEGISALIVKGYRIKGDEGGTWTTYDTIDVIMKKPHGNRERLDRRNQ